MPYPSLLADRAGSADVSGVRAPAGRGVLTCPSPHCATSICCAEWHALTPPYVPVPSLWEEDFILRNRRLLADQMEFLMAHLSKSSRL